jgi:anti-sigma B factor antagonist
MINAADFSGWQVDPFADDPPAYPFGMATPVGGSPADRWVSDLPAWLLQLTVQHYPAVGICVVVVNGELDTLTAPLLEEHVRSQLLAAPAHLVLDLEPVRFLGAGGLSCLLRVRELTRRTAGSQLHLAGLITRPVSRALHINGLRELFDTHPTLIHAVVTALADCSESTTSDNPAPAPILTAFWCCSVGVTWTLELRELGRDTELGPIADWISSGVPVTRPRPDALTDELLAAYGLRFFPDPSTDSYIGTRCRTGYVCADAEVIRLAHLVRDPAAEAKLHPVVLAASWIVAGFSADTAAGWIRAGCLLPR